MKRLIALLMLFVLSFDTYAEWLLVSEGEVGETYIDLDRIVQEKDAIKVWTLINYKKDQESNVGQKQISFRSFMSQIEFDCKKRLFRYGAIHYLSDPMGQGETVFKAYGSGLFDDIAPNAFEERFFYPACKSKK